MKTRRFISQTITLLLATMLLMVAGVKSSSVRHETTKQLLPVSNSLFNHQGETGDSQTPDGDQATVSSLALDAVITPAVSFDFCQYFYFLPPAVWHFVQREAVVEIFFKEPSYLISGFSRIFGIYIVTNAP